MPPPTSTPPSKTAIRRSDCGNTEAGGFTFVLVARRSPGGIGRIEGIGRSERSGLKRAAAALASSARLTGTNVRPPTTRLYAELTSPRSAEHKYELQSLRGTTTSVLYSQKKK